MRARAVSATALLLAALTGCSQLDVGSDLLWTARFETGDFLFREGAPADRFYALRHGRVCVESFVPGRGADS